MSLLTDLGRLRQGDQFARRMLGLATLAFGLLLAAGTEAVFMAIRADDAERLVAHTFEVRQVARTLLSDLQDAETGQRGFLLTEDAKFLEPFVRAESSLRATADRLRKLVPGITLG